MVAEREGRTRLVLSSLHLTPPQPAMAKVATDLFAPLPSTAPPTLAHLLETTPLTAEPAEPVDLPSPPPLNSALFLGKDFDASEFLLARRHTALEELRSEVSASSRWVGRSGRASGGAGGQVGACFRPVGSGETGVRRRKCCCCLGR